MLRISKNWGIGSDGGLNILLLRRRAVKKTGTENWTTEGYYSSVKNAMHDWVNMEIREAQLADSKVVLAKIEELHKLIEALKEVKDATHNIQES